MSCQDSTCRPPSSGQKHLYDYRIDAQGRWFCQSSPVTDPDLLRLLGRGLYKTEEGYKVCCQGEVHPVIVADAPYLVSDLNLELNPAGGLGAVELVLSDGRAFPLSDTLSASAENILYARLGAGVRSPMKARFARRPFFELMRFLEKEGGDYFIQVAGRRFYVSRGKGAA